MKNSIPVIFDPPSVPRIVFLLWLYNPFSYFLKRVVFSVDKVTLQPYGVWLFYSDIEKCTMISKYTMEIVVSRKGRESASALFKALYLGFHKDFDRIFISSLHLSDLRYEFSKRKVIVHSIINIR